MNDTTKTDIKIYITLAVASLALVVGIVGIVMNVMRDQGAADVRQSTSQRQSMPLESSSSNYTESRSDSSGSVTGHADGGTPPTGSQ